MDELTIGTTRKVDDQDALHAAIAAIPGPSRPLSLIEFERLISTGKLTEPPREADLALYLGDSELSKSDTAIREDSGLPPDQFRRLRRAWLYQKAIKLTIPKIEEEQRIYNSFRHQIRERSPNYGDYVAYLEAFHYESLEAFFRPWALPLSTKSLKAHSYICGAAGSGKSELLKIVMYGLLKQNQGVILFDPHGELAEQVSRWKEFKEDPSRLIYFDPRLCGNDYSVTPCINPLTPLHGSTMIDSAVDNFIHVIDSVVGGEWEMSSRMKTLLKPCLYYLADNPRATLFDLIDFMAESDREGRDKKETPIVDAAREKLKNNKILVDILSTFFDTSYNTTKLAIRDRLRALLASHGLSRCLVGKSTIDLKQAMDTGKFVIFNLARGPLGDDTSSALGRFLIAAIQNLAMQRQEVDAKDRRPVYMFMDEGNRYISDSLIDIYSETRKYGLHLGIVQQIYGFGMNDDIKKAVLGNSNVKILGGQDEEADRAAKTLGITTDQVKGLQRGEFQIRTNRHDTTKKIKVPSFLAGNGNRMTEAEWETVKAYQVAHYYRQGDGEPGAGIPTHQATQKNAPTGQKTATATAANPPNFN
jgi:energy-coupling factor transporter ATP-binding protein EcfA2